MLYNKYVNKMKRLVSFVNFIKRIKSIIITVSITAVSLTTGFMTSKGAVIEKTPCPVEVVYGDDFSFESVAIFADIDYEYAQKDSEEWTKEKPVYPGEYKARGYSKGSLGKKRTGKEYNFTIVPKNIDVLINENSITYGEMLSVSASLAYNDEIYADEYVYEDISSKKTFVYAQEESIVIKNDLGIDVTSAYTFNLIRKEIDIISRNVKLLVGGLEKEYDKTPLKYESYQIKEGTLASGDTLISTFTSSITNVGTIKNKMEAKVLSKNGYDVTKHYNFTFEEGNLTVILVSHSMEDIAKYVDRIVVMNRGTKMYDGRPKDVFAQYKELEKVGLAAPQVTYMMHALAERGISVNLEATTIEEAVESISKVL